MDTPKNLIADTWPGRTTVIATDVVSTGSQPLVPLRVLNVQKGAVLMEQDSGNRVRRLIVVRLHSGLVLDNNHKRHSSHFVAMFHVGPLKDVLFPRLVNFRFDTGACPCRR